MSLLFSLVSHFSQKWNTILVLSVAFLLKFLLIFLFLWDEAASIFLFFFSLRRAKGTFIHFFLRIGQKGSTFLILSVALLSKFLLIFPFLWDEPAKIFFFFFFSSTSQKNLYWDPSAAGYTKCAMNFKECSWGADKEEKLFIHVYILKNPIEAEYIACDRSPSLIMTWPYVS